MNRHECPIDVRWGDLDMQGHVNNVAYMTYFEHARAELILSIGRFGPDAGVGVVVVQANVSYRAPALYPAALKVVTSVPKFGTTSMVFHQVLQGREDDTVYAEADITAVWINAADGKPIPVPQFIKAWSQQDPEQGVA